MLRSPGEGVLLLALVPFVSPACPGTALTPRTGWDFPVPCRHKRERWKERQSRGNQGLEKLGQDMMWAEQRQLLSSALSPRQLMWTESDGNAGACFCHPETLKLHEINGIRCAKGRNKPTDWRECISLGDYRAWQQAPCFTGALHNREEEMSTMRKWVRYQQKEQKNKNQRAHELIPSALNLGTGSVQAQMSLFLPLTKPDGLPRCCKGHWARLVALLSTEP